MKVKKRQKVSRMRGSHTHCRGFKKKARGKGHRGGVGMAGTGKRADQKKTLIINLYGNDYFGRAKTLRRGRTKPKLKEINLGDISPKKTDLSGYKILSMGEPIKGMKIKASAASQGAIEKVKKAGGEITILSDSKQN